MTLNDSGLVPVEYKCVVKLERAEEKTAGGIILTKTTVDREQMATTTATLLAVGGNAFDTWEGRKPECGDRVMINKYAGQYRKNDADPYRVCNDKDILAVIEGDIRG